MTNEFDQKNLKRPAIDKKTLIFRKEMHTNIQSEIKGNKRVQMS